MDFFFEIDNFDISNLLQENGISWTRNDIDGPNAGRTIGGLMIRDRVATKIRLDITCKPLLQSQCSALLNAILPEYVTVHYIDPMYGEVPKTMYPHHHPVVVETAFENGEIRFTGITFPLIER